MDRRRFLGFLAGSAAAAVAVRTFPFRTYSIPENPYIPADYLRRFAYLEWDDEGAVWYLHPEQAKVYQALELEVLRVPPANPIRKFLRAQLRSEVHAIEETNRALVESLRLPKRA